MQAERTHGHVQGERERDLHKFHASTDTRQAGQGKSVTLAATAFTLKGPTATTLHARHHLDTSFPDTSVPNRHVMVSMATHPRLAILPMTLEKLCQIHSLLTLKAETQNYTKGRHSETVLTRKFLERPLGIGSTSYKVHDHPRTPEADPKSSGVPLHASNFTSFYHDLSLLKWARKIAKNSTFIF